jgi:hypothetical protein
VVFIYFMPDRLSGPHSLLSNGHLGRLPSGTRPGREVDYSLPPSAEVKNGGAVPPLHHTSSRHVLHWIQEQLYFFTFILYTLKCYLNYPIRVPYYQSNLPAVT